MATCLKREKLPLIGARQSVAIVFGWKTGYKVSGAGIAVLWRPLAILLLFAAVLLPLSMGVFAWSLRRTKITGTLTHS